MRNTLVAGVALVAFLVPAAPLSAEEEFTYIGAGKCKICHQKEDVGAQYPQWQSTAHSKAFETLGTPEAAEIARKAGIEGSPQEAAACMKCHATAWGLSKEELAATKLTMAEGVSCESCHGPGSAYWKKKTMEDITAGKLDGATVGLVEPNEALCRTCHNEESPTFKGFDLKTAYPKIAHPHPDRAGE